MGQFVLQGLELGLFQAHFTKSDAELAALGMCRVTASAENSFPCRVSLQDAEVGEVLLLLPFEHHPVDSPYRSSGPIYVRLEAETAVLGDGVVPDYITRRLISLRAYNAANFMVDAMVCAGSDVAGKLTELFENTTVDYIHLHNAKPGCYSCLAVRAER